MAFDRCPFFFLKSRVLRPKDITDNFQRIQSVLTSNKSYKNQQGVPHHTHLVCCCCCFVGGG